MSLLPTVPAASFSFLFRSSYLFWLCSLLAFCSFCCSCSSVLCLCSLLFCAVPCDYLGPVTSDFTISSSVSSSSSLPGISPRWLALWERGTVTSEKGKAFVSLLLLIWMRPVWFVRSRVVRPDFVSPSLPLAPRILHTDHGNVKNVVRTIHFSPQPRRIGGFARLDNGNQK